MKERQEEIYDILNQTYTDFRILEDDPDWVPEKGAWGYSVENIKRLFLLLQEVAILPIDAKLKSTIEESKDEG